MQEKHFLKKRSKGRQETKYKSYKVKYIFREQGYRTGSMNEELKEKVED